MSNNFVISGIKTKKCKITDDRSNKPRIICDKKQKDFSMVIQEIDEIKYNDYSGKNRKIDYYSPNNIGILLTAAKRFKNFAKNIYILTFSQDEYFTKKVKEELHRNSKDIYDYIETIQIALVFSYTTIETFANTSIPDEYVYETKNNKGILEKYDKDSIERWIPLKEKISIILVNILKTPDIKKETFWNDFCKLEKIRNSIIHQKNISGQDFYKNYFDKKIFNICEVAEKIITFFVKNNKSNLVNVLWPVLNDDKTDVIFTYNDIESEFEKNGNMKEKC